MLFTWSTINSLQCCGTNGCNWNEGYAKSNSSPDQAADASSSDVVVSAIAGILLGFVVLIFCLFIFFLVWCRKDNDEDVRNIQIMIMCFGRLPN